MLCVDEKSQVQALQRSQPAFPMMPGMPERRTHDYVRHGTTTLFAAMNVADGTVITSLHRRHRATEFKKFLTKIDDRGPRRPRDPPDLRQLRHPQAPDHQDLARSPPPGARCTSPRPTHPGSTWSSGSSATSPPTSSNALTTAASRPSKPTSATGSKPGTPTPSHSSGPRPPNRSSATSADLSNGSQIRDTSVPRLKSFAAWRLQGACSARRRSDGCSWPSCE